MSITTAVVLVVLILAGFLGTAATLVALAMIRGWVDVRKIGTRQVVTQSQMTTQPDSQLADHPMFHK